MRALEELTQEELLKVEEAEQANDTSQRTQDEEEQVEDEAPIAVRRYSDVVKTVRTLLANKSVDYDKLTALSDDEREALKALADVISGRKGQSFTYAEDRLLALNETLARLSPILSIAMLSGAEDLRSSFERVRTQLSELRTHLNGMEAAEDLLFFGEDEQKKEAGDDDDDDDEGDDEGDGDADGDAAAPADGDAAAPAAPKKPRKAKPPPDEAPPAADGGADA